MSETLTPDVCIVGAGSAGLVVAAGAAQLGLDVVLIERAVMGGDCLNYGCVPSKALIAAAKAAQAQRSGAAFGIAPVEPKIDFGRVMDHVAQVIAAIAPNDSVERFEKLGVRVLKEEARFVGRTELLAGPHRIKSRRIVLATGSRPTAPPIPGLAETPYLTNETVFANRILPDHLIVIGGGPIGLEMAQAHRRLGARVTVLEALDFRQGRSELSAIVVARSGPKARRAVGQDCPHRAHRLRHRRDPRDGERLTGSHLLAPPAACDRRGARLDKAGVAHTGAASRRCRASQTSTAMSRSATATASTLTHMAGYELAVHPRRIVHAGAARHRSCRGNSTPTPSWRRSA
jgi:thioredoxin reductase